MSIFPRRCRAALAVAGTLALSAGLPAIASASTGANSTGGTASSTSVLLNLGPSGSPVGAPNPTSPGLFLITSQTYSRS